MLKYYREERSRLTVSRNKYGFLISTSSIWKRLLLSIFLAFLSLWVSLPKAHAQPFAYITNYFDGTVSVIDTSTNTVVDTITVGDSPKGVAVSPTAAFVYVGNQFDLTVDGTVSVIDTSTNTVVDTITVGRAPEGIAVSPDGASVYVVNVLDDTLSVIDTSTNTVVDTITVGMTPIGVAVAPNGAFAYVTHGDLDEVSVIDTSTNTVIDTITVGRQPYGVAVSPDGAFVYVVNNGPPYDVSVIDTSTNTVVDTVPVGAAPFAFGIFIVPPEPPPLGTLVKTFESSAFCPGLGTLVGIGLDPVSGNVFIYPEFDTVIHEFTPVGTEVLPTITRPGGGTNSFDLDFLGESVNIGGTTVPTNSLLVITAATNPDTAIALNKDTGAQLASVNLTAPASSVLIGGSYHEGRDTIFVLHNFSNTISEINPATGAVLNSFPVAPAGSPAFTVFFGDVDVNQTTGNLFVVGSRQNVIRELTPTGGFVQDFNLGNLFTTTGLSGIAIDDATGDMYVTISDCVHRLRQVDGRLHSFDPGLGALVGIGFDPISRNVFIYDDFTAVINEFTQTGEEVLPTIPRPGTSSNNFDLDFLRESVNIGGTTVGSNSLLVINGADSPDTAKALDKGTGAVLASVNLSASGTHVGGSYHEERNSIFVVNADDTISEINPVNGAVLGSFPVRPTGSPRFGITLGDVDVDQTTGNLLVVGSDHNRIRELTPTGAFVRDIEVGSLGISGLSGIAVNDLTGTVFLSSTNGNVYRLGFFEPSPAAMADLSVTKDDSADPVAVGDSVTYTITVTNSGPDDATGVALTDNLPSGVTFDSASAGCTESGGVVTCDIGDLANGANAEVEIVITTTADGTITNTVNAGGNEADPNNTNNSDAEDTTVDTDDQCPEDPNKTEPGVCGCGVPDTDSDGDGIPNCNDACPNDPQNDVDGDGVCGNVDNCPTVSNPGQEDSNGNNIGDECENISTCNGVPVTINTATNGADVITGTAGNDVINGLDGNDRIDGKGGSDIICGGNGNDTIKGGGGRDILFGDAGKDTLEGGSSADKLFGGGGSDTLRGGDADDKLNGGSGRDTCDGGNHINGDTATSCETVTNVP